MNLQKLTITSYKSAKCRLSDKVKSFKVLINPDSYQTSQKIKYEEEDRQAGLTGYLRFYQVPPSEVSFKLVFDGTGLVSTAPEDLKGKTVPQQIKAFRDVTAKYEGSIHRPYMLIVSWGKKTIIKGVLTQLDITYKLFDKGGVPLRAEANATFKKSTAVTEAKKEANVQSPDVTHIKELRSSDTLPALSESVYDGNNFFVQVAQANQLNRLRGLETGQLLKFPALAHKSNE